MENLKHLHSAHLFHLYLSRWWIRHAIRHPQEENIFLDSFLAFGQADFVASGYHFPIILTSTSSGMFLYSGGHMVHFRWAALSERILSFPGPTLRDDGVCLEFATD